MDYIGVIKGYFRGYVGTLPRCWNQIANEIENGFLQGCCGILESAPKSFHVHLDLILHWSILGCLPVINTTLCNGLIINPLENVLP